MRTQLRILVGVGVVGLLLVAAAGVGAGSSRAKRGLVGPDIRISSPAAGVDWSRAPEVAVAWNATANEYLVVWSDARSEAVQGSEIYGRRVTADGTPLGGDIHLTGPGGYGSYQCEPAVAWNADSNEYLVVWSDWRTSEAGGPGANIWGRRVGADGSLLGRNLRISGGPHNEVDPAVAWNAAAYEYLVVWEDDRHAEWQGAPPPADGWETYGRRLNADATRTGGWIRVSGPTGIYGRYEVEEPTLDPAVAWNAVADEYLVVWQDGRQAATRGRDIMSRRVDADGTRPGGNLRVSGQAATADEGGPAVAWNATATEYLVVWHDGRDPTRGSDIYARRLGVAGTRLGRETRVSGPLATGGEQFPAVAWNGNANQYLVVWQDERDWASLRWEVYGRLMTADGPPAGGDFRINSLIPDTTTDQLWSAVAFNTTVDQYLVVWRVRRHGAGPIQEAVYGRRVAG